MNKKFLSLKQINIFLIITLFFIFISIILSWSYIQTSKIINKSKNNYFKQSLNMSKIIFEQEKDKLNYISFSLAKELSSIKSLKNKKVEYLLNSNAVSDELDLLYLEYDNKTIDYSYSLFNTKEIIKELSRLSFPYDSNFISIKVNKINYILILSKKNIIDKITGRVKAKLYTAKILNDNLSFIDKIKYRTNSLEIAFIKDNIFISSSISYEDLKKLDKNDSLTKSSKKITLDNDSSFNILFISKEHMFNELKDDFIAYTSFILFTIFSIIVFLIIATNKKIIKPLENLIVYSKELRTNSEASYFSDVKEFNNLAKSLKRTIKELKSLKEKYSLAIDGVEDGLWDNNLEKKEIYLSKRYKKMLGYTKNDNISSVKFWLKSIHKDDLKSTLKKLSEHLKRKSNIYEDSYRLKCKDGSYKWIKVRGKAFFDKNNKAYRITGLHSDINEFKLLQKENSEKEMILFQQSKLASMGEMIANIAHQWRQPLNHISSLSSSMQLYMQYGKFSQDDVYKDLDKINDSVQYLSLIIDKFKNFFRPNNKKEEFYISNLIANNMPIINSILDDSSIKFITNINDIKINGYKTELFQVLINLINNSKDALIEKNIKNKRIFLHSYIKNNMLYIELYDNALGIESSLKDKIYEPYFTTKKQSQGTGIGLYMSLQIIQKYFNGKIYNHNFKFIYNERYNIGEKFIIEFPLEDFNK